ncbi:MAG TPA: hypothetical protein VLA14_06320 [Polyangia bacterium]|jgi:hypothetical protein|nr:hypothetical protein [Polyangia bacterium]
MQPFPPSKPTKKGAGLPTTRRSADPLSSLFSTGSRPPTSPPRAERGVRIANDLKRALFFAAILVFVGIVLYQFVSAL